MAKRPEIKINRVPRIPETEMQRIAREVFEDLIISGSAIMPDGTLVVAHWEGDDTLIPLPPVH